MGSSAHLHGVVMLTGAAASSTSFSLGQDAGLTACGWKSDSPTRHGALSLISLLGTWPVLLLLFHNSPFSFIIFIFELFSVIHFQEWIALFGN